MLYIREAVSMRGNQFIKKKASSKKLLLEPIENTAALNGNPPASTNEKVQYNCSSEFINSSPTYDASTYAVVGPSAFPSGAVSPDTSDYVDMHCSRFVIRVALKLR